MPNTYLEKILENVHKARELYYSLILIVGSQGSGKTKELKSLSKHLGIPVINVNLELSREMLHLTERQRILKLENLFKKVISDVNSEIVLLDNVEILFDPSLEHDPLAVLKKISRNLTLVAALSCRLESDKLIYANSGHPEYKEYSLKDLIIVDLENK